MVKVLLCAQERQRLVEKFGPNPYNDKADLLVLLDKFRESEARLAQARSGLYYATSRYGDDDESANRDASAETGASDTSVYRSINYARKALGKLRLEMPEQKSNEKTGEEDGALQHSDVSSTSSTAAGKDDKTEPDSAKSSDTDAQSSSVSSASDGQVNSSREGGPAAGSSASVEVPAEKCITANDMDGIAVCLT